MRRKTYYTWPQRDNWIWIPFHSFNWVNFRVSSSFILEFKRCYIKALKRIIYEWNAWCLTRQQQYYILNICTEGGSHHLDWVNSQIYLFRVRKHLVFWCLMLLWRKCLPMMPHVTGKNVSSLYTPCFCGESGSSLALMTARPK